MRWKEIIAEMAPGVFYHGTANEKAALSILEHGINPPDLVNTKNTMLRPVIGRVYVTPHISYAQVYAIGGDYAGNAHMRVPYEGNEDKFVNYWGRPGSRYESRYGYVFVIPPSALVGDQQPDEDDIGQLYSFYLRGGPDSYVHDGEAEKYEALKASGLFQTFVDVMNASTTDAARRRIKGGEYSYYARAGKTALKNKRFTPDLKKALIAAGCHVAHEGTVIPTECWKIDKAKVGWLEKNGRNFFEIAERIR